jgi:hydroxymethylpyrimidine pyrophosphatase-like HAD family hydrolase
MANASAKAKAAADHIAPSNNDDGFAQWIEQYILE